MNGGMMTTDEMLVGKVRELERIYRAIDKVLKDFDKRIIELEQRIEQTKRERVND